MVNILVLISFPVRHGTHCDMARLLVSSITVFFFFFYRLEGNNKNMNAWHGAVFTLVPIPSIPDSTALYYNDGSTEAIISQYLFFFFFVALGAISKEVAQVFITSTYGLYRVVCYRHFPFRLFLKQISQRQCSLC